MNNLEVIRIKKGLDIPIPGAVERKTELLFPSYDGYQYKYAVKPTDYVGVAPRLLVSEGAEVLAGSPLFEDKNNEGIPFVSPVSGKVKAIVRGEKRKLLSVIVEANEGIQHYHTHPLVDPLSSDADTIRNILQTSGMWNMLRQRPFGIVPRKGSQPKAIFISGFDSSPLPVDYDYMLQNRHLPQHSDDFQWGINALSRIAPVHLSLNAKSQRDSFLAKTGNAVIHFFEGPHPAGLVGTQIAFIDPINKGETVWTINIQDVATIGFWFRKGFYYPERLVAFCGPDVVKPKYYSLLSGSDIPTTILKSGSGEQRIICGDVLSGVSMRRAIDNFSSDSFLSASCDKVCFLPEGDYYDFMGWLRPNFRKYSFSRTFLSGFLKRRTESSFFTFDTGKHGSVRPLFVTGEFEKLVPLDIYPMQLIKACIIGDIDLMENLGIYEVEPEDLALCEFADTSKTEIQAIIRNGLEKIRKELGL
ncbi:MAG: Na(+)-translocating NADH-quinone reductase subunit A [Bacteroidales bacterium]|nr:Na(+)-translocating NADH-quinone reductase subunit A [Bacteroidales bacterium]